MNIKYSYKVLGLIIIGLLIVTGLFSQEDESGPISTSVDIYTSYIWRGTKYGTGPALQPEIEFARGKFTAGAWGSFDFSGYQEADIYLVYSLPAGFTVGVTDYYYPDFDYFDYSQLTGSHAFEISLGFAWQGLSLSANYILNEAGNAGSEGGDKYFEAKYDFKSLNLFIGAGDGWHTVDSAEDTDRFAVCNIGLGTTRTIKVTDTFSIPLTGQLIFNPDISKMYISAGFSF